MGRIKDLLIVYGRNHYPDDIEATIQEITGGRAAAIAVPDDRTEKLVAIVEIENGDDARDRQERRHVGDVDSARSERRGSGPGAAGIDTHHDERQGQSERPASSST